MADDLPGGVPRLVRIDDYVSYHAGQAPTREALVWGPRRWDYAALDRDIDRIAAGLIERGLRRGDRVAMLTTPRPEFILLWLATLRAGAIWVGVNSNYRNREIETILDDADPVLFVSLVEDGDGAGRPEASARRPAGGDRQLLSFAAPEGPGSLVAQLASPRPRGRHASRPTADPRDAAVIVYTSGTTGVPKGAVLSHANFVYSYEAVSRSFSGKEHLRDDQRMLCNLPPNHIGCLSEMAGNTLIRGGTLIFNDRFDPDLVLETIRAERVTLFGGVPAMLRLIVDHPDFVAADLSSVRAIGWGGAPAPDDLVATLLGTGAHLFTNYGLTEGGAVISATPPAYDLEILTRTVGAPAGLQETRIVDDAGRPINVGEAGEIEVRGAGVFLGYWNNDAATRAAISEDGWLKTGDMAFLRADGLWALQGRRGDMFKSGGYNVYPREVELALEEHPAVALAAVVGVPDPLYFETGYAFVQPVPGAAPAPADLHEYLRGRLARYKIPKRIRILDRLPILPIGKIDKPFLKKVAIDAGMRDRQRLSIVG